MKNALFLSSLIFAGFACESQAFRTWLPLRAPVLPVFEPEIGRININSNPSPARFWKILPEDGKMAPISVSNALKISSPLHWHGNGKG
jgi:hypothetical protein